MFCVVLLPSSRALQNGALNVLSCGILCCVAPSTRASTKRGTECFVLCYVQNVALSVLCCACLQNGALNVLSCACFLSQGPLQNVALSCFVSFRFVLCCSFLKGRTNRGTEMVGFCVV